MRVRVERRLPALSSSRGHSPAHDSRWPALGNTVICSPDGSRFLMIKNLDGSAQPSFVVVQNWLADVADRLPQR